MSPEKQLSWDKSLLRIAKEYSTHSTCSRKQVGAIIAKDNRIISTGMNGSPSGMDECQNQSMFKNIDWKNEPLNSEVSKAHHMFSVQNEIHAEMNAIITLVKNQTTADNCTLYTTLSPCSDCAKAIVQTGITRVVFSELYDRDKSGINLLENFGIKVEHMEV